MSLRDSHTADPHRWADCEMCGRMVICGKCGNNCCNGGYGEIGGVQCDACTEAYAMQDAGEPRIEPPRK